MPTRHHSRQRAGKSINMSKAIFTYTTKVAVSSTVSEIEKMLVRAGAISVLKERSKMIDLTPERHCI